MPIKVSDACFRCDACFKACPVPGTFSKVLPGKVRFDAVKCIECRQCVPVCPARALTWSAPLPKVKHPVLVTEEATPLDLLIQTVEEVIIPEPMVITEVPVVAKKPRRKRVRHV